MNGHALKLPQRPALIGFNPPANPDPVEEVRSAEVVAQTTLNALLERSPLTPEKQFAVALNVAVLALARMPGMRMARGKYIKAAVEDFKTKLQRYLPTAQGNGSDG